MVCPVVPEGAAFDVEAAIASFLADANTTSLELPPMAPNERKRAKQVADSYPEIACESFGFGAERKLLLQKRAPAADSTPVSTPTNRLAANAGTPSVPVKIKNTFIDDWDTGNNRDMEKVLYRSMPSQMTPARDPTWDEIQSPSACEGRQCPMQSPEQALEDPAAPRTEEEPPSSPACAAPSPNEAAPALPGSTNLQVRNTFIHIQGAPADERVVQSMPHGMFGQCLLEEAAAKAKEARMAQEASAADAAAANAATQAAIAPPPDRVAPGTLVVIEGLSKLPAFNGCFAYVQYFDEGIGRYSVMITLPDGRQQWAKVKGENLRPVPVSQDSFPGCGLDHISVDPGVQASVLQLTALV